MVIRIRSLLTTAGFLKDAPVEFAPGLTCIIGARGTCKSTIVETIRFAFDCDPDRVKSLCAQTQPMAFSDGPSTRGLVRATLRAGIAKCTVTRDSSGDTETLSVERELDAEPRIYYEGIQELVDRSVLHAVEIYSQGDLQRIAEEENLRLELIDRPNKKTIGALIKQRANVATELRRLGPAIREKATEIEARRADVRALESLRMQLAELRSKRPTLTDELDAERTAALQRKSVLDSLQQAVRERSDTCEALRETLTSGTDYAALVASLRVVSLPAAAQLADSLDRFAALCGAILRDINGISAEDLAPQVAEIEAEFERKNAHYYKLRQEQQEVNESLKREDALKQQIGHLEKLQQELDGFLEERRQLLHKRADLRSRLQQIGDQIHDLRQQEVDKINSRHADVVILALEHGTQSDIYTQRLVALLQGSRLHGQEDVARDLAANIRPGDLVDIVETGDSQRLTAVLDRDLGQMARLVSFLMDKPELYKLEGVVFDDRLEITMYDRDTPKPVSQLSKGQMATALLPLILRPAPYPLVFDQPEDDLDNSFIYRTLVQQIHKLKQERQLIFVTHNANIPVLGEADSVVVMEMETPTQATPPTIGTVDEVKPFILDLLEGGAEAFRRRQMKYSRLLLEGKVHDEPSE